MERRGSFVLSAVFVSVHGVKEGRIVGDCFFRPDNIGVFIPDHGRKCGEAEKSPPPLFLSADLSRPSRKERVWAPAWMTRKNRPHITAEHACLVDWGDNTVWAAQQTRPRKAPTFISRSSGMMEHQHILLLGATGASGLVFIDVVLQMPDPQRPFLTLYVRPGSRSKLPESVLETSQQSEGKGATTQSKIHPSRIRIVEGHLDDVNALRAALSTSELDTANVSATTFPHVTTIVSFLGAYISLKAIFTRDTTHPIVDSFRTAILPAIKACCVHHRPCRIMVLSTPTAFVYPAENQSMSWKWWLYTLIPALFAPQGNAEMKGIADAVVEAGNGDGEGTAADTEGERGRGNGDAGAGAGDLEWTVFRVPHLTDGNPDAEVVAGFLDRQFTGTTELSRRSLVRWVLREIEERKWIRRAPMLGNA
ncbi:hypothetical protein A1O1_04923 [Capronia coronata CBS 617.96]|uniref:NAD(P)-binding domain-containing protein n=1 Tax=Capronia coronata CBS 617.96 TaxID=1182541 RepID=W9YFH0_9EURO|nr:uncharacterized protein A1O1_04923 [Capronia coronata CBS 617.96]EXJ87996.1 hypothetical protein A1O1_04923 [Capronia coronata CBS 617.96]